MADITYDSEFIHRLKNKLAVATGFARLLVDEAAADDPRRSDLLQISTSLEELTKMLAGESGQRG